MPVGGNRGGGGSGFSLGPLQNEFVDAAARDAYATANVDWLTQYNDDRANWIRTGGAAGQVQRRNVAGTAWENVTPIVSGPRGNTGPQTRSVVSEYANSAAGTAPTVAAAGSYVIGTGEFTPSTGATATPSNPPSGQVIWERQAVVNPVTDTGTVDLSGRWGSWFERPEDSAAALDADRAEAARDGAETALSSSGAALAFNDFWTGDIDITTSSQWKAVGTEPVPSNATWLLWNGGAATAGANDGPSAEFVWINAAKWRALTADTVDTTPGDGTGMPIVEWFNLDVGDGSPDFARRDLVLGRTTADVPLMTSTDASEDLYGATLMYITQAVATPGGMGGASSFSELSGQIADDQVPDEFTRDTELDAYAALAGAIFTGAVEVEEPTADANPVRKDALDALIARVAALEAGGTMPHSLTRYAFLIAMGNAPGDATRADVVGGTTSTTAEITTPNSNTAMLVGFAVPISEGPLTGVDEVGNPLAQGIRDNWTPGVSDTQVTLDISQNGTADHYIYLTAFPIIDSLLPITYELTQTAP